jgi:hypothetical protein
MLCLFLLSDGPECLEESRSHSNVELSGALSMLLANVCYDIPMSVSLVPMLSAVSDLFHPGALSGSDDESILVVCSLNSSPCFNLSQSFLQLFKHHPHP